MQRSHSSKAAVSKISKKQSLSTSPKYVNQQTPSEQQSNIPEKSGKSQNVRVVIRIRPMNQTEIGRGDINSLKTTNSSLQINHKAVHKQYEFNYVLDLNQQQKDCYHKCQIAELIDAAIDGYSATVFAYGQTGSGKTYTMAGKDELFTKQVYKSDQREGIIPRAIQQLWKTIKGHKNKYSIKASYSEIYNQQIKDLLNMQSGVLHCRWNQANGFFVEDLVVVDCSDIDDMISVLNEGMKNRKSGSHEMNKDSSRSHSIMTLYIITQAKSTGTQTVKKYGKITFVDLAGSERLKQSKSQGQMIKETGNINKSLFTLGKVIKGLTDKKSKTPYIPYRDSKLTMLLMDSLGGNSKALMIACVSPSEQYFDQTLSTLNYAARTMNIRNKPIIQMDQKDQIIHEINQEIQELKKQNIYLREQYQRVNKGLPLRIPELQKGDMIKTSFKLEHSQSIQLPPLDKNSRGERLANSTRSSNKDDTDKLIIEYQLKFEQLKKQNQSMRLQKDQSEQSYKKLMDTNSSIQNKLENLEQIFLNKKNNQNSQQQIVTSGLLTQNTQLKKRLRQAQKQKIQNQLERSHNNMEDILSLQNQNQIVQKQIEKLQSRQKQLLGQLQRKK